MQIAANVHPNDIIQATHNWLECLSHPHQRPPNSDWLIWLLLGGRGSGKTRAGAEWIRAQVADFGCRRIALVAPTYNDAREVMLEGESGLLNIGYPSERPHYIASRRRLEWPNGAVGQIFTSEEPDGLRGPQFDCAWADEFCAWHDAGTTMSNLRLALRLGDAPKLVVTTTPKPTPALKALMVTQGLVISRAKTSDNQRHLAPNFITAMTEAYGGTRLGRQELDGELIEDMPGALWRRDMIDAAYMQEAGPLKQIIVSIDPPVTSGPQSDACGIIVAGVDNSDPPRASILHDGTVQGVSPNAWAREALSLFEIWGASYILAEVNQGGEMVSTILHTLDPNVPIKTVHARKSKVARAHPVAMLYEQGRVKHVGRFDALSDELCVMGSDAGFKSGHSPDRADALVWAVTDLLLNKTAPPSLRHV